jgi:hypothetical protein
VGNRTFIPHSWSPKPFTTLTELLRLSGGWENNGLKRVAKKNRVLIRCTISVVGWRYWGKSQETPIRIPGMRVKTWSQYPRLWSNGT